MVIWFVKCSNSKLKQHRISKYLRECALKEKKKERKQEKKRKRKEKSQEPS